MSCTVFLCDRDIVALLNCSMLTLSVGLSHSQVPPRMIGGDLTGVRVVGVAAGGFHSIALAADGRVFTFGAGKYGVLGHGDEQDQLTPRIVEESH